MFCSMKSQLYSISECHRDLSHVLQYPKPREKVGIEERKSVLATFTQISFGFHWLSARLIPSNILMDFFFFLGEKCY